MTCRRGDAALRREAPAGGVFFRRQDFRFVDAQASIGRDDRLVARRARLV
jgi:hypothetical protein